MKQSKRCFDWEISMRQGKRKTPRNMNEAVAWWKKAAQLGSPDAFLNIGLLYAQLCTNETDLQKKSAYLVSAVSSLTPMTHPAYRLPQASFYIGVLTDHFARHILNELAGIDQEARLQTAHVSFAEAAHYYSIAADMDDVFGDMVPACAANA